MVLKHILSIFIILVFLSCSKQSIVKSTLIDYQEIMAVQRKVENINQDWSYLEHNFENIEEVYNHTDWKNINLPHTWNQWDAVDNLPGYRRDASWYKKDIFIPDLKAEFILYFEGANMTADIYLNGAKIEQHIGGYVGFEVNITKHINKGNLNSLLVRVDNSVNRDIIPSQKADFFIYGGITRDVWLKTLPELHLNKLKISTPEVSTQKALTHIDLTISKEDELEDSHLLISQIIDKSTREVIIQDSLRGNDFNRSTGWSLKDLKNPKLWSPKNPNLYEVHVQLWKDQQLVDEIFETIGYRWFRFEEYGAFFLNGERLLLRGTHRHEEHAGYGAAMPNELHRKDIEQIKDVGANFLRLGHYPQDPEIYKACNELGIIVWDELPWCRGGVGKQTWKNNTERLFIEQINQNFNHPSILFWSLGNEIYWLPDFENGNNEGQINTFLTHLNDIAHSLDPYRMTSIRKYYAGADLVDVFSPSIWSGWYAGVYTNYKNTLEKNQKKYPRFLHMEYGGSSHVGRHTENPITGEGTMNEDGWAEVSNQVNVNNIAKEGDWTENYIVDLFDWYLSVTEKSETFAGNAQWAFKDFGTPLRPENAIPYLNQKGLVDRSGKPKDAYYVFKSYWSHDPFTYIESHSWTERRGQENEKRNISVYSNCDRVEFFHNGNSLGTKEKILGDFPANGLTWDVMFTEGENKLSTKGFKNGIQVSTDSMTVNYSFSKVGKPEKINLSYKVLENGNYLIEAKMSDENDMRILDYEKYIYFSHDGQGQLLKNYGTPTRSQVIQMANGYAAIELVPSKRGKAIIEVRNQDFKGSYLTIDFDKK